MPAVKLNNLGGIYPSILPRNLADMAAQKANNLQPGTPEFRPFATDLVVATVADSNPRSLYRFARNADGSLITSPSQGWKSHPVGVTIAKGQLNDDRTERTYFSYDDGSAPPREFDNQGGSRLLGVPKPTVKPAATTVDVYTFTEEIKRIEKLRAVREVVLLTESYADAALVGVDSAFQTPGWLLESSFSLAPDADRHIVRLFALDPATNQIISTYSSMPIAEASWVFNPALGGAYATLPTGFAVPSWATGHTKWWRIRLRAFAGAYKINQIPLTIDLQAINLPGTQGAKKYLNATEAAQITSNMAAQFDTSTDPVATLVNKLSARQAEAAAAFNQGGQSGINQAVKKFYARADIAASISSATNIFAETVWRYFTVIGTATAEPFYIDQGSGGGG